MFLIDLEEQSCKSKEHSFQKQRLSENNVYLCGGEGHQINPCCCYFTSGYQLTTEQVSMEGQGGKGGTF